MPVELRPLDDRGIEMVPGIFWSTFLMGRALPFEVHDRGAHERLVLGWYLENPSDSRLVWWEGRPVGYVLVCTDQARFERWQLKEGVRYLRRVMPRLPGMSPEARRFVMMRLLDGLDAWRDEDPVGAGAHAHFNLERAARSGLVIKTLIQHVDDACSKAGLSHWTGQMNDRGGGRRKVMAGYGFRVVSRSENRTLSHLLGEPVERLTVVRQVGEIQRLPTAS